MNTHTPGPWGFEPDMITRPFSRQHSLRIYSEDPGPGHDFHIGYVMDVDAPTREANARLIAAAPELLEALESLEDAICSDPDHEEGLPLHYRGKVEAARRVIAKARGAA